MTWKRWAWLSAFVVLIICWGATPALGAGPSSDSWIVHHSIDIDYMQRGPNRVNNPGFESGGQGWINYDHANDFQVDNEVAHTGSRSVRLEAGALGAAIQQVTLNQPFAQPIYVSGWSKASQVTGGCRMQYSLYLDIFYTDGTQGYSQHFCFSGGTHGWRQVDQVIFPEKPIASVYVWTMFQSGSPGKAWFDDIAVGEYVGDVCGFDEFQILHQAPEEQPWQGADILRVDSGDGLSLGLTAYGGAVASLLVDGQEQVDPGHIYAGGFFVRDVAADSDYVHLGGTVTRSGGKLIYRGADADLGLELTAKFRPRSDHIILDASLQDTTGTDRAISLYFALPIAAEGRTWWQDIRTSAPAESVPEHRFALDTTKQWGTDGWEDNDGWGANGLMSHYCLSSLDGPAGLSLAYPMDRPVVSRFAYNSSTYQYFVVCELGLSPQTQPYPSRADVRLLLYHHDPEWGFRAAFDKYVAIYPDFFTRRVAEDGIWVAHADLDGIPDIADFDIRFHETGNSRVYEYDDSVNAYTLRYLTEPWGYWLRPPQSVPTDDYDAVMDYVESMLSSSVDNTRRWGNAILSSGGYGWDGRYLFEPTSAAFAGHADAFILNADPDLDIEGYTATKASQSWGAYYREPYSHPEWGILDGEYIDSFESRGLNSNYRQEHFPFSDHPLTFATAGQRVVLPHIFSSYEFTKWVSNDVHRLGKYCMGNSVLLRWAFPAHLFDIMGSERGWVVNGQFLPDADSLLNLWRTFSYRKPYCVLQNGDLPSFTHDMVEEYFAFCAFYGIYPSFFTHDGGVTNYWERPAWYERDRDLFVKYIPKIIALNQAGWEPVTYATTNKGRLYIERYGSGPEFYFALRNTGTSGANTVVSVDLESMGLPITTAYTVEEWLNGRAVTTELVDGALSLSLRIPASSTRILRIEVPEGELYSIDLIEGWNLVSLPGLSASSRVADIFGSIRGQFDRVYVYDTANRRWLTYDDQLPWAGELTDIDLNQGIWIRVLADTTWQIRCIPQVAASIPLQGGWNLVGYPLGTPQDISTAIESLGDRIVSLYAYDATDEGQPWRTFHPDIPPDLNTLSTLEPAKGYWIEVTEACNWGLQSIP